MVTDSSKHFKKPAPAAKSMYRQISKGTIPLTGLTFLGTRSIMTQRFWDEGSLGMHPSDWRWKWLFWQVLAPILGPIFVSFLVVLAWHTGQPGFHMQWSVVLDVSPWALTFYAMTLIGATMNDFWPKMQGHAVLGISLFVVAVAVALYASFIVVWRHDPTFTAGTPVYGVTLFLLFLSIVLCHQAAKLKEQQ